MKFLALLFLLPFAGAWADTAANCELIKGIYPNGPASVRHFQLETLVDIFTINNARTITLSINDESLRFLRSELTVGTKTQMTYQSRNHRDTMKTLHIVLDRTPRETQLTREFNGNMHITQEDQEALGSYNFYCRF